MSRKREKPLRIVRPCCSAAIDAERAWREPVLFPHLRHCPRWRHRS